MPWKSTALVDAQNDALFNNTSFAVANLWASLHDGHPGNTGANEVAGGSYGRVEITSAFPASSGGTISSNAEIQWTGMPATDIFYVGLWSASSGGTFYGYSPIEATSGYFTAADTGDLFTSYAHGLLDDDRLVVYGSIGQGLPAGPSEETLYYVITSTTDTFQISATEGGGAVALTSNGEGVFVHVVRKAVNLNDDVAIASGNLTFREQQ